MRGEQADGVVVEPAVARRPAARRGRRSGGAAQRTARGMAAPVGDGAAEVAAEPDGARPSTSRNGVELLPADRRARGRARRAARRAGATARRGPRPRRLAQQLASAGRSVSILAASERSTVSGSPRPRRRTCARRAARGTSALPPAASTTRAATTSEIARLGAAAATTRRAAGIRLERAELDSTSARASSGASPGASLRRA